MTKKINENGQLDSYSKKIIAQLQSNGRLTVTELAKRIGLSKTPCQNRLHYLQEQGYILGFKAVVNHSKLNREHIAFTEIKLSDTRNAALQAFNAAVSQHPEIEECHLIASSFDYLLKVRTADIKAYRTVLSEIISNLPHVANTSTHVSMQAIKDEQTS